MREIMNTIHQIMINAVTQGSADAFAMASELLMAIEIPEHFSSHEHDNITREIKVHKAQCDIFAIDETLRVSFIDGWNKFDLETIKQRSRAAAIEGQLDGWWDLNDNFEPIAHPIKISMSVGPTLAHAMAKAGVFKSISEARKNGFKDPIRTGIWTVGKTKIRVQIVD